MLAALGWLSTGCSIVFNGEEFKANGPSQPTVQITESPTTLDAIEVTVVTASVDPNGETVSYEYAWQQSGVGTDVITSVVPPERTAKGETWTVTVTPVAGDRVGAPATASATVINSPPIVRSVGFSTYRPRADESLRALPGGAYDPDGEPFTFQFA